MEVAESNPPAGVNVVHSLPSTNLVSRANIHHQRFPSTCGLLDLLNNESVYILYSCSRLSNSPGWVVFVLW
jgi:hypothetical protein